MEKKVYNVCVGGGGGGGGRGGGVNIALNNFFSHIMVVLGSDRNLCACINAPVTCNRCPPHLGMSGANV